MVDISNLISHRFRGFAPFENTLEGLRAALDFGVQHLEFDIRVARCGTPLIYHDEYAKDGAGKKRIIAKLMASEAAKLGGTFDHISTADNLFAMAAAHPNQTAHLHVDIKDAGFEEIIHALVCYHGLQRRVTYVSWVPNALYALHDMAPEMPLCLSHWCKSPNKAVRLLHKVHDAKDGNIPRLPETLIHGERSGWYVNGAIQGEMRNILTVSKGAVCVPQNMITADLAREYRNMGLKVSTFSYVKWKAIHAHQNKYDIDFYFIDNKAVFDQL